jgi:hypothetical protein
MPLPLCHPDDVLRIHEAALDYVIRVQQVAARQGDQKSTDLVSEAALSVLAHETTCLHRATRAVCVAGWAFAAPIILRAMLEATCSTLVIVNSGRPEVAAFKYFYAHTKEDLGDPSVDPQRIADEVRANMSIHMAQMTPEDQRLAHDYLQAPRAGHFWYSDEFAGPTVIIRRYAISEVLDLYGLLSIAAHAGFLGMRIFRDDPDLLDVNPRQDARATGFALISSSRVLAEGTRARAVFEMVQDGGYDAVTTMIRDCRIVG